MEQKIIAEFERHGWVLSEDGAHLNKFGVHPYLVLAEDERGLYAFVGSFSDPTAWATAVKLSGDYGKDIHAAAEAMKRKKRAFLEEAKHDVEGACTLEEMAKRAAYWLEQAQDYEKEIKELESCE